MYIFKSKFATGARVNIDNDKSISAVIVSVVFVTKTTHYYNVEWFSNGCLYTGKIEEWRLSKAS